MRVGHKVSMMRLRKPLAERLADYKASKITRPTVGGYYWTVPELRTAKNGGRGFYQSGAGLWVDDEGSSFDLRLAPAGDFIDGRLSWTTGYYTDHQGDGDTLKPIVARLPRGRGFLAGWTYGEGMAATLDGHRWDNARDAAYAAHQMAEQDAAEEADYQEQQDRIAEIEELAEALRSAPDHGWGLSPEGYC